MNYSIIISILALAVSSISAWKALTYSRINILHSIQQLMLKKANDCNFLWAKMKNEPPHPQMSNYVIKYIPTISEIIISIQLLDNSLDEYSQTAKRQFFLKQFWIQIDTSLREFFKEG